MPELNKLHHQIEEQYGSDRGCLFYQTVMGDGGFDIHYGIYKDSDTTMRQATEAATERLLDLSQKVIPRSEVRSVVDLGSGRGGPAHYLATQCECDVMCVDLCQRHHDENVIQANKLGIIDRIDTWCGSFEALPGKWKHRFDLVWAQETLCHATDVGQVLHEANRVVRPGGAIVFSDIMLSDDVEPDRAYAFSHVNAVVRLATPSHHRDLLAQAGFAGIEFEDWTKHLKTNFRRMRSQIERHRIELEQKGVESEYLREFSMSLDERIAWTGDVLRWGAFTALATD